MSILGASRHGWSYDAVMFTEATEATIDALARVAAWRSDEPEASFDPNTQLLTGEGSRLHPSGARLAGWLCADDECVSLGISQRAIEELLGVSYVGSEGTWRGPMDEWLAGVLLQVHASVPFTCAVIGPEAHGDVTAEDVLGDADSLKPWARTLMPGRGA